MAEDKDIQMRKRKIALKDGRYMIFYTFEDDSEPPAADKNETGRSASDAGVKPRSGRERDV